MSGVNKVIIVGRLGQDPDLRYTGTGTAVCNISLATSFQGKGEEVTEWHRVILWDKLAANAGKFLAKGREVYVEGRLQTRQWEKDGIKRHTTEVVATNMVFLGGGGGSASSQRNPDPDPSNGAETDMEDDDLPF